MTKYTIFVNAQDDSQWGEGWLEIVQARNREEAKAAAISQVQKAIEQPDADLVAYQFPQ